MAVEHSFRLLGDVVVICASAQVLAFGVLVVDFVLFVLYFASFFLAGVNLTGFLKFVLLVETGGKVTIFSFFISALVKFYVSTLGAVFAFGPFEDVCMWMGKFGLAIVKVGAAELQLLLGHFTVNSCLFWQRPALALIVILKSKQIPQKCPLPRIPPYSFRINFLLHPIFLIILNLLSKTRSDRFLETRTGFPHSNG